MALEKYINLRDYRELKWRIRKNAIKNYSEKVVVKKYKKLFENILYSNEKIYLFNMNFLKVNLNNENILNFFLSLFILTPVVIFFQVCFRFIFINCKFIYFSEYFKIQKA